MTLRTVTYDDSTYKLVPIEPTELINRAIDKEMVLQLGDTWLTTNPCSPWNIYKTMIAAAPEYQEPEELKK